MTELRRPYEEVYRAVDAAVIEGERRLDKLDRENQRLRLVLAQIEWYDNGWASGVARDALNADAAD